MKPNDDFSNTSYCIIEYQKNKFRVISKYNINKNNNISIAYIYQNPIFNIIHKFDLCYYIEHSNKPNLYIKQLLPSVYEYYYVTNKSIKPNDLLSVDHNSYPWNSKNRK